MAQLVKNKELQTELQIEVQTRKYLDLCGEALELSLDHLQSYLQKSKPRSIYEALMSVQCSIWFVFYFLLSSRVVQAIE